MGVMISAMSSTPRDFDDAANAAIDEKSFSLSEGNWREHLEELFFPAPVGRGANFAAEDLSAVVDGYLSYHAGKIGLSDSTQWHLGVAAKLQALIAIGQTHGCDRVGISG